MTDPDIAPNFPADELLRHSRWLRRLARSLVLDDAEADDLVQETWLQALSRDREGLRDPRAWLAGVARNVARNRGRSRTARRARERAAARSEAEPSPLDGQVVLERQRALLDRVEALDEPYRSTLLARYFEGLAPRAIAGREGVPVATVKSRLARALARLRTDLDAEHGGRREWALWLLPLARGAKPAVLASRVLLPAAVLAALAGGAVLAFALRDGRSSPAPIVPDVRGDVLAEAPPARDAAREPASSGADRVEAASSALLVRVLDAETGAPVPGARVRFLDGDEIEGAGERTLELYPDTERVALELGREATTDAAGEVRLAGRAPWFVHASRGATVAAGGGAPDGGELVLRLVPVPRVGARVEDDRGRPVAEIPVAATLDIDMNLPGLASETWEFERVTDDEGEGWFLDPMGFWAAPVEEREGRSAAWTAFLIDLPGVPESAPNGRARTRLGGDVAGRALEPVRLELPATGVLDVVVLDAGGQPMAVEGRVRLEAIGGGGAAASRRYEVELVEGRGSYPRVAPGLSYRATVSVPELGATWVAEGVGPRAAGERATLEVRRPDRRVWTATIVDEEGRPVAGARATLYLEDGAKRFGKRQLGPLRTADDGTLRVEIPDEVEPLGGFHFDLWRGVERAGVDGTVAGDPARAEVDLGRHVARFGPTPIVRGRCVDPGGAPLRAILVGAPTRSGISHSTYTQEDGTFELSALFPDRVELEVTDPGGVWLPQGPPPVATPDGDGVVVVLARGASLVAQLRIPEIVEAVDGWQALAWREGAVRPKWGELSPTGALRWEGLEPGVYRVELRMLGNAPLAEIEGVRVAAGENRDARIDATDLGALLRRIHVTAVDPSGDEVPARVVIASEAQTLHQARTDAPGVLVPTAPGWSLLVAAPGWRVVDLGEVTRLGDEVAVELSAGLEVELVPRGANERGSDWSWRAEGPLGRVAPSVTLPAEVLAGGTRTLRFAAAGRYRLVHQESSGDSDLMAVSVRETPITIEVRDDLPGVQRVEFGWE